MTTKQHAQRKLTAAEKATTLVLEGKNGAINALTHDTVNGYGILRDPQTRVPVLSVLILAVCPIPRSTMRVQRYLAGAV